MYLIGLISQNNQINNNVQFILKTSSKTFKVLLFVSMIIKHFFNLSQKEILLICILFFEKFKPVKDIQKNNYLFPK
jgi:hypothetical protein